MTEALKASMPLLVFVHGLFGDCRRTWGEMPRWVLNNAGVDLDVTSFDYPAQFWERSSIEQATYDLKTWLSTEFSGHRHLIFVTHSVGGLIVKHLLREEFCGIQRAIDAGVFDYSSSGPGTLWLRTRHVVNVAAPHQGGAPLLT
ncbi:MAG: esterase/lipase family protein, partial [bacterium]